MKHPTQHIFEHSPESLAQWCADRGLQKFRARQVLEWVYQKHVVDPVAMSNLSVRDRELLAREMTFLSGQTVRHQRASDGTQKLLVEWSDAGHTPGAAAVPGGEAPPVNTSASASVEQSSAFLATPEPSSARPGLSSRLRVLGAAEGDLGDTSRQTECVMIPALETDAHGTPVRRTACISSQVGCPVGCRFCASGLGGLDGNLSAGRIVEQVWRLGTLPEVGRITNVVFMGMGEPLSNFKAVTGAIRTITALWGLGISARKITISTVGLPRAIERLAEEFDLPVTLALSLHAPNDEIRRRLIPWAEYTTIADLLAACQKWFEKTGREITLEYTLLRGVNDAPEHAAQLADVARTLRANVNLIRYNEVAGMPFERPGSHAVLDFQKVLRARHINAHIRASRGRDISAACGQLRHEGKASTGSGAPADLAATAPRAAAPDSSSGVSLS